MATPRRPRVLLRRAGGPGAPPGRFLPACVLAGSLLAAACASGGVSDERGDLAPGEDLAASAAIPDGGPRIVLGPMVGHTTDRSTSLWVKVDRPGMVRTVVTGENGEVEEARGRTDGTGIVVIEVDGLDPATRYAARFELDGSPLVSDPAVEFRTFPREGAPARLTIMLVSCARMPWDSVQTIWRAIDADRPDVVVWLGDNGYFEHADSTRPADYTDPDRMEFRYAQLRGLGTLQPLLRHAPHYAIWDDRDYDGSDSDRTNPLREEVTRLFERFWANPSYGEDEGVDGVYGSFRVADVEVFLLDDRFFRDPDSLPDSPSKTVLGSAQKTWLKEGLAGSEARLKIVAIGHQVLADYHQWESYAMFAHERDELLDWIRRERIDGVVFVDGDRHLTELMRWEPSAGYPLYEFTSSPVANRYFEAGLEIPNPIRIDGYADGPNYGLLEIDTTTPAGRLAFVAKDTEGREVMRHEVTIEELTFDPPGPEVEAEVPGRGGIR